MGDRLTPLTDHHLQLLAGRGITGETAAMLGWQTLEGRKGDWISIPFLRNGKEVNQKHRTISGEKKFTQTTGGEQCFYNLQALEDIAPLKAEDQRSVDVVITEGEMDCAIALQCGYLAVSVPSGAPAKAVDPEDSVKFDFLKDLPKYCILILAVDDDPAGIILRQELALRVGWHRCKWVQYPKACKDLNEVFTKYGKKGVDKVLKEKTKFMNAGGLFLMSELPALPDVPAYECNIGNLSDMIKIRPGDTVVVTGIPSMGKTLFVNCLSCNMARDYGWNVCVGSFEQSPQGDHKRYLRTYYLDKTNLSPAGFNQWSDAEISEADAWIDRHFNFIVPDVDTDEMVTLKWVLERIRSAINKYGARMVIIDPWNELDHDRPNGMSLTEYTGYAIKEFKRLAKQYMVAVVIVAHPSKMEKNKEGSYGIPTLYDISDSSHWANKCDLGIIVHRFEGETPGDYATFVRVAKVRHWGIIGRIGEKFLQYMPERGKYIDYPDFVMKKVKLPAGKKTETKDKKDAETPAQTTLPYAEN